MRNFLKHYLITILMSAFIVWPAKAWISYEHSEMGDIAFRTAIAALDKSATGAGQRIFEQPLIWNKHEAIGAVANNQLITSFSFGQLVAIYGDYALNVGELNSLDFAPRVNSLKTIVSGINSTKFSAEHAHMKALAISNPTHFSLRAAQQYTKFHRLALQTVREDPRRLWQALHYEAIAVHSLTDLFALGHMLEDRQLTEEVFNWANSQSSISPLSKANRRALAEIAGKAMGGHVNFNHNAHNWKGSMMMNLAGFTWRGYGDGKYRIVDATCSARTLWGKRKCSDRKTDAQRKIIVHATMLSILDILKVASGLETSLRNEFHAICYVPVRYWDTQAPVPPENQLQELWKLRSAMNSAGRPIEEHGFDFSLGYLKFESTELRGNVDYIDYIKQHCNLP